MKRVIAITLIIVMLVSLTSITAVAAAVTPIKLIHDGVNIFLKVAPILSGTTVMLPIEETYKALGFKVIYDSKTKAYTITKDTLKIYMPLSGKGITVNGKPVALDVPILQKSNINYISYKFFTTGHNLKIAFDAKKKVITLITQKVEVPASQSSNNINLVPILVPSKNYFGTRYGLIDRSGNIIVQPQYEDVRPFSEGMAAVRKGFNWGFIDSTGKEIIKPEYSAVSDFKNGFARVTINFSHGYIDKKGKILGKIQYSDTKDFSEGLAAVQIASDQGLNWGYINEKGEVAIPFMYKEVYDFSDGLGIVRDNTTSYDFFAPSNYYFVDKSGNRVHQGTYNGIKRLSGGYSIVKLASGQYNNIYKYGVVDSKGNYIIQPEYDWIIASNEANMYFTLKGKIHSNLMGDSFTSEGEWTLLDGKGQQIAKLDATQMDSFKGGLARVQRDEKWGYIDTSGKDVIPFKYDNAMNFSEGMAGIQVKNEYTQNVWGFVDLKGNIIIKPVYNEVSSFSDGLAIVNYYNEKADKCYSIIDKTGKKITVTEYDSIEKVDKDLYKVSKSKTSSSKGIEGYINHKGQYIWKYEY